MGLTGCCGIYVTAFTARLTRRLPDLATEDTVLRADFTADLTDFFAAATFPLFLAGFLATVFFDRASLRAMESSSQWLPWKTLVESPGAWKGEHQGQELG